MRSPCPAMQETHQQQRTHRAPGEAEALPANFPVPSQDVVLNFLLLFFVHMIPFLRN